MRKQNKLLKGIITIRVRAYERKLYCVYAAISSRRRFSCVLLTGSPPAQGRQRPDVADRRSSVFNRVDNRFNEISLTDRQKNKKEKKKSLWCRSCIQMNVIETHSVQTGTTGKKSRRKRSRPCSLFGFWRGFHGWWSFVIVLFSWIGFYRFHDFFRLFVVSSATDGADTLLQMHTVREVRASKATSSLSFY